MLSCEGSGRWLYPNRNVILLATGNQWKPRSHGVLYTRCYYIGVHASAAVGWRGHDDGRQISVVLSRLEAYRPAVVADQKAECWHSQDMTALELPRATVALPEWRTVEYFQCDEDRQSTRQQFGGLCVRWINWRSCKCRGYERVNWCNLIVTDGEFICGQPILLTGWYAPKNLYLGGVQLQSVRAYIQSATAKKLHETSTTISKTKRQRWKHTEYFLVFYCVIIIYELDVIKKE